MKTTTGVASLYSGIIGAVMGTLSLASSFGLKLSPDQQTSILGFVSASMILVSVVFSLRGADRSMIVESLTPSGKVLAGEANELPTGSRIRDLGDISTGNPIEASPEIGDPTIDDIEDLPAPSIENLS